MFLRLETDSRLHAEHGAKKQIYLRKSVEPLKVEILTALGSTDLGTRLVSVRTGIRFTTSTANLN